MRRPHVGLIPLLARLEIARGDATSGLVKILLNGKHEVLEGFGVVEDFLGGSPQPEGVVLRHGEEHLLVLGGTLRVPGFGVVVAGDEDVLLGRSEVVVEEAVEFRVPEQGANVEFALRGLVVEDSRFVIAPDAVQEVGNDDFVGVHDGVEVDGDDFMRVEAAKGEVVAAHGVGWVFCPFGHAVVETALGAAGKVGVESCDLCGVEVMSCWIGLARLGVVRLVGGGFVVLAVRLRARLRVFDIVAGNC